MSFSLIHGYAVVDGYQPDGDTIRFVPDDMKLVMRLPQSHLVAMGADTSVSVRLEGIDAPELHYEGAEQPAARPALDALLREIRWPPAPSEERGVPVRSGGSPRGVRVAVLTRACDSHGRVIGYVFPRYAAVATSAARLARVEHLVASVNARLLGAGVVYPLAYQTQPSSHRLLFCRLAAFARKARKGIWLRDRSRDGFALHSEASLGAHGALVFPKLFRRSVVFFREAARGIGFKDWLRSGAVVDDVLRLQSGRLLRLSDVLVERNGLLHAAYDLVGLTFAEA